MDNANSWICKVGFLVWRFGVVYCLVVGGFAGVVECASGLTVLLRYSEVAFLFNNRMYVL